jgi:hypothetical protein
LVWQLNPDAKMLSFVAQPIALDRTASHRDVKQGAFLTLFLKLFGDFAEEHWVSCWDTVILSTWICAWPPLESKKSVGADLATKWADGQQAQDVFTQSTSRDLLYQRDSTMWTS